MRLLGSGIGKKDQVDWDMVPPQSYQHCRAVRSASIGSEYLSEILTVCHFRTFALHQPLVKRLGNQAAEVFHRFHDRISYS